MSRRRKKQQGGYLDGPLHEDGGIPAIISGGEEVELEGGEYIINAQTVDALGVPFLDKINSTATTYHTGGFGQGQLPNPSMYKRGGQIRRKRRFHMGGGTTGIPAHSHPHTEFHALQELPNSPQTPGHIHPGRPRSIGRKRPIPRPIPRPAPGTGMIPPSDPGLMGQGRNKLKPPNDTRWQCGSSWHCGYGMVCVYGFCVPGGGRGYYPGGQPQPHGSGTGRKAKGGLTPRLNPRRMGHGGGVHTGSPDSCQDGYGNNVPC